MNEKYESILHLPHHKSDKRPHMKAADRVAQFMPFAALTGYDVVISEEARQTARRPELAEDELVRLDEKLKLLRERREGTITYFVPDRRKPGSAYVTVQGRVKKFKDFEAVILLEDGTEIPIREIIDISWCDFPK